MNKTVFFCIISFLLFLFIIPASFAKIEEYSTTIDANYHTSKIKISLLVSGGINGINNIKLPFSFYPKNAIAYSESGLIKLSIEQIDEDYVVVLNKSIASNKIERIYLELEKEAEISQIDNWYLFGFSQSIPEGTKLFEFFLKLPEGTILANLRDIEPVSPEPDRIGSDGRKIILSWVKQNVLVSEEFRIIAAFEGAYTKDENSDVLIILMVGALLVSFSVILLTYVFFKSKETGIVAIGLDREEKKIYEFILSKRETKQKEIQKALEMSKARLSKLLRKLEEKELIEKKPFGRTNLIKIKRGGALKAPKKD